MELYLVQHGEAMPKSLDRTRPLSEQGRQEVRQVAVSAARMGLAVGQIRHSGKTRAEQTAGHPEWFACQLECKCDRP